MAQNLQNPPSLHNFFKCIPVFFAIQPRNVRGQEVEFVENWKNPPLHNSLKSFATQPRNAIGQTMAMQWFEKSSFDFFM